MNIIMEIIPVMETIIILIAGALITATTAVGGMAVERYWRLLAA